MPIYSRFYLSIAFFSFCFWFSLSEVHAATYTVTTTADSGAGSLRQAVIDANANAGADEVLCDASLSGTITLATTLPAITEAVTLDCSDSDSAVTVTTSAPSVIGFSVEAVGAYVIQGWILDSFESGIKVEHSGATVTIGGLLARESLTVQASEEAGVKVAASTSVLIQNVRLDNNPTGLNVSSTASNVVIGGTLSSQRNIIVNNATGIEIAGSADDVQVINNYIGLDSDGVTEGGNTQTGVRVLDSAIDVVIGGSTGAHGNVIGYSGVAGVELEAAGVTVRNNVIGLDADEASLASNYDGILVVGSQGLIQENVISGNSNAGIMLRDDSSQVDQVQIIDNIIGLSSDESTKKANGDGIALNASNGFGITNTLIQDNRIAGNTNDGIDVRHAISVGTQIWGNIIGSNTALEAALGNGEYAMSIKGDNVDMDASANNAKRNIIIHNEASILVSGASGLVMENNYIGWDGTEAAANVGTMIVFEEDAEDNQLGGVGANEGNTFCADSATNEYVTVSSTAGDGNAVRGNSVVCPIGLNDDPIISVSGAANNSYSVAPTVTALTTTEFSGSDVCVDCSVDLYGYASTGDLEYLTTVVADETGAFADSLDLSSYIGGVLAYTDALGNTSTSTKIVPLTDVASNFLITNTNNSGIGSLRVAISNGVYVPGDEVELRCHEDLSGTITLTSTLPILSKGLTLDCSDTASQVTFAGSGFTLFDIDSGSNYVFEGFKTSGFSRVFDVSSAVSSITLGGTGTNEELYLYDPTGEGVVSAADNLTIHNTEIELATTGISISSGSSEIQLGTAHASGSLSVHDTSSVGISISGATGVTLYNILLDDNVGNALSISSSSSDVTIGGVDANQRNIITGAGGAGVYIENSSSIDVVNNYIGINSDGSTANGNGGNGVVLTGTCTSCVVGGDLAAEGNVIASSSQSGISVAADGVTIQNNKIGTNAAGTSARANGGSGVRITSSDVTVEENLISGNTGAGVYVIDSSALVDGIIIRSNTIGLQQDQATALGNDGQGIFLQSTADNGILESLVQDNIIGSNGSDGINLTGAAVEDTQIWGNKIGSDVTGLLGRGNAGEGISLSGGPSDLDASLDASKRNIIVDNDGECIKLSSSGNIIRNQYCGYAADGTTELANANTVTSIGDGAADNIIGGIEANQGNKVCATADFNVYFLIAPSAGSRNSIRGNTIGCDDLRVPLAGFGDLVIEMIDRPFGGTGNNSYAEPSFDVATPLSVSGSNACASCEVDIYGQDSDRGAVYIGTGTADGSGVWAFESDLSDYDYAIATYTDEDGSTSISTVPLLISAQTDADGDGISNVTEVRVGTSDSDSTDNDTIAEQTRTLFLASNTTADGVPLEADMTNSEASDGGSTPLLVNVDTDLLDEYEEGFADPTSLDLPAYSTPGYPTRAELQAVIDAVNAATTPSFTITQSGGTTAMQEEATDSFTVVLSGLQPTSNVVFNVSSADTGAVTVSPSTLTFTNGNWSTAQTVTVTGLADDDTANESVVITVSVDDASSDDDFDALADQTLTATVTDTTEEEPVGGSGGGGGGRSQTSSPSEPNPQEPRPEEEVEPEVLVIIEPTITETLVSEKDPTILGDEFTVEEGRRYGYPIGAFDILADEDMDGLPYLQEVVMLTSEENPDSDGDGIADGLEVLTGTDPLNPNEFKIDALDITLSCPEEGNFIDTDESFARVAICVLVQQGIVQGRQAERFFPDEEITRGELTKMILLTAGIQPKSIPAQSFKDLDFDAWYYPYVTTARKIGLIEGYADGTFKPNQPITRAEAVSILVRAFRGEGQSIVESPYQDVLLSDWFAHNVLVASQDGLIVGRTPGFFAPFGTLTRAEATILIRRAQYAYAQ